MDSKPWVSGPREILQHAVSLISVDNDVSYRIAFLTIDNAVEIMIKTFLSLPEKITGIKVNREEQSDISYNFPKLIATLETKVPQKIKMVELEELEWFHRLRNQLYHQGNGITIEKDKVKRYFELANELLYQLFDSRASIGQNHDADLLIKFFDLWAKFEQTITQINVIISTEGDYTFSFENPRKLLDDFIEDSGFKRDSECFEDLYALNELYEIRNRIISGELDFRTAITPENISSLLRLIEIASDYRDAMISDFGRI